MKLIRICASALLLGCMGLILAGLASCSSYGPKFDPYASGTGANSFQKAKFSDVKVARNIPAAWLKPSSSAYKLGPGDELQIEVVGITNTISSTFVTPDGKLYYENVHGLRVKGMSLPEVKASLEKDLSKWYHSPQVSLALTSVKSQRVWILGRVNSPGVYPLNRPMTLVEGISQAGGLATASVQQLTTSIAATTTGNPEDIADLSRAFLIRDGKYVPIDFQALLYEGDMKYNIYLKNGDYIYLPAGATKEVFVMGAVVAPRAVRYVKEMSLVSAISEAGGPAKAAHLQNIVIIRGSLTSPQVAVVPFEDIQTGEARDVALQPHDIVWVPRSPWERIDNLVQTILSTFTTTVAVNEGARLAVPGAVVGTSISVGGTTATPSVPVGTTGGGGTTP